MTACALPVVLSGIVVLTVCVLFLFSPPTIPSHWPPLRMNVPPACLPACRRCPYSLPRQRPSRGHRPLLQMLPASGLSQDPHPTATTPSTTTVMTDTPTPTPDHTIPTPAALEDAAAAATVADMVKPEPLEVQEGLPQQTIIPTLPNPVTNITNQQVVMIQPSDSIITTTNEGATVPSAANNIAPVALPPPQPEPEVDDDDDGGSGDIEQDLAEFLQGGPLLPGVCDSPSMPASGGLDPADLM